jgi:hypothetical protein
MASPGSNTASSPLVLAILDGVGLEGPTADNAVTSAAAPFLLGAIAGKVDGQPVVSSLFMPTGWQ